MLEKSDCGAAHLRIGTWETWVPKGDFNRVLKENVSVVPKDALETLLEAYWDTSEGFIRNEEVF